MAKSRTHTTDDHAHSEYKPRMTLCPIIGAGRIWLGALLLTITLCCHAAEDYPYPDVISLATPHSFDTLWERLSSAVKAHDMLLVSRASASRAAKGRGIDIPGNGVFGVFRNDFAVRMLQASVPAGIEAPLRFYLTENADGTTTLTYRKPSAVFAPYGGAELEAMAAELDGIFSRIATQAAGTD